MEGALFWNTIFNQLASLRHEKLCTPKPLLQYPVPKVVDAQDIRNIRKNNKNEKQNKNLNSGSWYMHLNKTTSEMLLKHVHKQRLLIHIYIYMEN